MPSSLPLAILLTAAVAIMVVMAAAGRAPTSAQTDPVVSVDAVSDSANTATSMGPIDTCRSTTTGATFNADVVIQGVTNIAGFQADLLYNQSVLKVTAVDYKFLLASTFAAVLDLGDTTPDTDGDFFLAAAMFSLFGITGADGDGVLARVTFQAIAPGSSALDFTQVKLSDANGNPIQPVDPITKFYIGPVNDASVVVDASCEPCPDADGDGWCDSVDNCPDVFNPDQTNTDAELAALGATMFGTPLPPDGLGDACDDDDDNDGFTDAVEGYIGTNALDNCPEAPGTGGDAWPLDNNVDKQANVIDVLKYKGQLPSPADTPAKRRLDLDADGDLNVLDVILYKGNIPSSCG